MPPRLLQLIVVLFAFGGLASAQSYQIRVTYNTNLRASFSLDSAILANAPAGTILEVVGQQDRWLRVQRTGRAYWMASWVPHTRLAVAPASDIDNCCFVDRQCASDRDWTDGYWAYQRNECQASGSSPPPASTLPLTSAPSAIDNCCYVNRQCRTDREWTDGYWAYQNNRCAAPGQGSTPGANASAGDADNCCFIGWTCQTSQDWAEGYQAYQENQCDNAQRQNALSLVIPEGVDNCCRVNRQCHTEADWQQGWAAFQHFRCSADIPMQIQGSSTFVALFRAAYNRLKEKSPRLYQYGITGFDRIREVPHGADTGVLIDERTYVQAPTNYIESFAPGTPITEGAIVEAVGGILHEACHVHKWDDGTATTGWQNELPCLQVELEGYMAVDSDDTYGFISWIRDIIVNIRNPAYWWWTD